MPGSNYLVARSLDRATDESSSARRVSSNGSEAARLTTHQTDDPLLVARLIRRPQLITHEFVARITSEPMEAFPIRH